jgi:hypothetical protein
MTGTQPHRKTDRKRGVMVSYVRAFGDQSFTRRDLPYTPKQSAVLLRYLWTRGEAILVQTCSK